MRKRLISPAPENARSPIRERLDLERIAVVEVTSEQPDYPIDFAFVSPETRGWRAAEPGPQTVRLLFDHPQRLKRISLVFEEGEATRTQEFVLRWSPNQAAGPFREIVRQQWNFSSPGAKREVEEYQVDLADVAVLELTIVPDISGGTSRASLRSLLVA